MDDVTSIHSGQTGERAFGCKSLLMRNFIDLFHVLLSVIFIIESQIAPFCALRKFDLLEFV